jgi:hypothetical protein
MQLYSVNLKGYKKTYWQVFTCNVTIVIAGYILVTNGYFILSPFYRTQNITSPILAFIILLSFFHAQRYRRQVKQLADIADFDERVIKHEKIYRTRVWWFFISCSSSCFLYVLSGRAVFLYLCIFDIIISLPTWPNKRLIRLELQNEEIIFLE